MDRNRTEVKLQSEAAANNVRLRTLVVDDTPELLQCIGELIHQSDELEVIGSASNGLDALHMAVALKPDLVLMDVNMPVMDGLTSTRELKRIFPGIQVVLMSAENSLTLRELAAYAGADQFIAKAELVLGTSLLLRMLAA